MSKEIFTKVKSVECIPYKDHHYVVVRGENGSQITMKLHCKDDEFIVCKICRNCVNTCIIECESCHSKFCRNCTKECEGCALSLCHKCFDSKSDFCKLCLSHKKFKSEKLGVDLESESPDEDFETDENEELTESSEFEDNI